MPQSTIGNPIPALQSVRPPRSTILRTLVFLLLSAGALLIFIALLGDWRRERNVLATLETYVLEYAERVGDGGALPLNLELDVPRDPRSRLIETWLPASQARVLRASKPPILAAWTIPIIRVLGTDGRGVIFLDLGRFRVEWVPLPRFDKLIADQTSETQRLTATSL